MELYWGVQPVLDMLREGRPLERIVVVRGRHGPRLREIVERARAANVPIRQEGREALDRLAAGGVHQGVAAWAAPFAYASRAAILDGMSSPGLVAVFDGVQDPHNLGALLRTAAASGCDGVFLPERRAVGLTAAVLKASAGTAARVPIAREASMTGLLRGLRDSGVWCVAVEAGAPPPWSGFDFSLPVALVLGGEGAGLRPGLRSLCEAAVGLPLVRGVESLNVSVAFGAVAYEVVRQRSQGR